MKLKKFHFTGVGQTHPNQVSAVLRLMVCLMSWWMPGANILLSASLGNDSSKSLEPGNIILFMYQLYPKPES